MTLTIKLGLNIIKVYLLTKICVSTSNGSGGRVLNYIHIHTNIHWTDSITSTADTGGNNKSYYWNFIFDEEIMLHIIP